MQARISQEASEQINLTSREVECLLWTAHGKTAWEISVILKISEATVNYHLKNAMRKLGVHSKAHAVAKTLILGLFKFRFPRADLGFAGQYQICRTVFQLLGDSLVADVSSGILNRSITVMPAATTDYQF